MAEAVAGRQSGSRQIGKVTRGQPLSPAVAETHVSVFFVGYRAYKLKKPVSLGFPDFRRREAARPPVTAKWS
jgi:aminoglycoside phosphotransferase family enzyme